VFIVKNVGLITKNSSKISPKKRKYKT
jgi:hypothetical protein